MLTVLTFDKLSAEVPSLVIIYMLLSEEGFQLGGFLVYKFSLKDPVTFNVGCIDKAEWDFKCSTLLLLVAS